MKRFFRTFRRWIQIARATAHEIRPWRRGYWSTLRRNVRLCSQRNYQPTEARLLELFSPSVSHEDVDRNVNRAELTRIQRRFNPEVLGEMVANKVLFHSLCVQAGLSVPRCVLVTQRGKRSWFNFEGANFSTKAQKYAAFDEAFPDEFVIKPITAASGRGVSCLRREGEGFVDFAGIRVTREALFERLSLGDRKGWIVQSRVQNHPALVELTGCEGLHTFRVKTFVRPDGEAEVLFAFFKLIATPDQISDAFGRGSTGNLWIPVDVDRGCFSGKAWGGLREWKQVRVANHPYSGKPLDGFAIPLFAEVVELALRAAREFSQLRLLAWDIGITPDAPVLIEGNHFWNAYGYNRSGRMSELRELV